jgi:hypothetical protein
MVLDPSRQQKFISLSRSCLIAQPVFRFFQLSGYLVDGSNRGSGITEVTGITKVSGITEVSGISSNSGGSNSSIDMVRVSHDSGGNGLLDDGLSLDGDWVWDIVRGINMDGGWDLDDPLGVEGSIKRGINLALNEDGILDIVDFSLGLDNGGVDSVGSPKDSWDSNGKMGGGWLVDPGGISGHIAGLSKVHLLGDNWGGLVDGGDSSSLDGSCVRGRGSGSRICYWGMGNNGASRVVLSSIGNGGSGYRSSSSITQSSRGCGIAKTMDSSESKSSISKSSIPKTTSDSDISGSAESASHNKGKCHL